MEDIPGGGNCLRGGSGAGKHLPGLRTAGPFPVGGRRSRKRLGGWGPVTHFLHPLPPCTLLLPAADLALASGHRRRLQCWRAGLREEGEGVFLDVTQESAPPPSRLSRSRPLGAPESCGAEGSPRGADLLFTSSCPAQLWPWASRPLLGASVRASVMWGYHAAPAGLEAAASPGPRSRFQAGLLSVRAGTLFGAGPASRNPAAAGPARPWGSPRASGPSGRPAPLTSRPFWQLSHCPGAPSGERAAAGTQGWVPGQVARALVSTPGWRSEWRSGATPLHKPPSLCQHTWSLLLPELSKGLRGHKEGG